MTTYNWINTQGGSWNVAANWNPPGGPQVQPPFGFTSDDAVFATGSARFYTVTGQGIAANTIVSGDRVAFHDFQGSGGLNGGNLIVENGGHVRLDSGSRFTLINHDGFGGGGPSVTDGTLAVFGTITAYDGSIGADGRMIFSGSTASGFIASSSPTAFTIAHGGFLGVQNGAQFSADGATIDGRALVSGDGSKLLLSGVIASDGVVTAADGGTLELLGTEVQGQVRLHSGNIQPYPYGGPSPTIDPGGRIGGYGSISGPLVNNGVVGANGGLLSVDGPVTGTGKLTIGPCATLSLGSDTSETIQFRGFGATLMLAPDIGAHGFLGGFTPGDAIDLAGTKVTSIGLQTSGHDTLLTAYDNNTAIDTFTIGGHIPQGAIALSDDGAGGTLMSYGFCGSWSSSGLEASLHDALQAFSHA